MSKILRNQIVERFARPKNVENYLKLSEYESGIVKREGWFLYVTRKPGQRWKVDPSFEVYLTKPRVRDLYRKSRSAKVAPAAVPAKKRAKARIDRHWVDRYNDTYRDSGRGNC